MRPFCGKQKYLLPYARYCCISPVVLVAVPVAGGNRNLLQLILIALPVISNFVGKQIAVNMNINKYSNYINVIA